MTRTFTLVLTRRTWTGAIKDNYQAHEFKGDRKSAIAELKARENAEWMALGLKNAGGEWDYTA